MCLDWKSFCKIYVIFYLLNLRPAASFLTWTPPGPHHGYKKPLHSTITYATVSHIHSVLAVFHLHNNPLRKIDSFRIYSLQFYSHVTYSSSQDRLFLYLFSEILCCFHFALFLSVDQYISLRVADVFSGQQQLFSFPFLCRSLMRKQADWRWRRVTWAGYGAVGWTTEQMLCELCLLQMWMDLCLHFPWQTDSPKYTYETKLVCHCTSVYWGHTHTNNPVSCLRIYHLRYVSKRKFFQSIA